MNRKFYIFNDCTIKRKDNNIQLISKGIKKNLRSEILEEIYIFGESTLNTKLLNFIGQKGIALHIYNYYGYYSGSFFPREKMISGILLVKQVEHYTLYDKRLILAKEFVKGESLNIQRNMRYYNGRGKDLKDEISKIEALLKSVDRCTNIEELMGVEGNIKRVYYRSWNKIINREIEFDKRVKRPPDNMINSLISFLNSMMYTTVLSEIYKTQLDPSISYLHSPGERRFSLSLDISEIFKPLIVDRLIFSLLNKNQITEKDFIKESNFTYLKEGGRKKIILEFNNYLKRTIKHRTLDRKVSYKYLIRLECYKLIKHLLGEKEYKAFVIWW